MSDPDPARRGARSRRRACAIVALAALALAAAPVAAQPVAAQPAGAARAGALEPRLSARLQRQLDSVAAAAPGIVGIAVHDLTTGERFAVDDSLVFPQASAIKIAILLELVRQAERGALSLDERIELREAQQVAGSGVVVHFADRGSALSLHDLAVLMIVLSDNTATNLLIERVGMARVNATLDSLGLSEIRLRRLMIRPAESARGNENVATPRAAAALMARLGRCDLPLSAASCATMRGILELPKGGALAAAIPAGVPVAWKPGGLTGVSTAWALVGVRGRPYAFSVMVTFGDERANDVVRDVARLVHAHFARLGAMTPLGVQVPASVLHPADSGTARRPR